MHKINEEYKYTHPHTHGMSVLTPNYGDKFNGHEYVDLGLPSGTLWAKMNVGATSETDYGLYFAWGEIQGYTAEQVGEDKQFDWIDYKFNPSGDGSTFTKYNSTDNKTVLDAEDDTAAVNMGGEWHMPTKEQCEELLNTEYVTSEWIENYNDSGIKGRLFTSVSNGNTLFIPTAGGAYQDRILDADSYGSVWSNFLYRPSSGSGYGFVSYLSVGSKSVGMNINTRNLGQSVRGVVGEIQNQR